MKTAEQQALENNVNTQIGLYKDILKNYDDIIYHIVTNCEEIKKMISRIKKGNDGSITIQSADYNKIFDYLYVLSDKSKFENLGILAKSAVPENEIKVKILKQLSAITL